MAESLARCTVIGQRPMPDTMQVINLERDREDCHGLCAQG